MPDVEKAVAKYDLDEYYDKALEPGRLGPGPRRVRPDQGDRRDCATATAATRSAKAACWPAGWSKPARASSRSIWPKVANSDNHSWDVHVGLSKRMKNQSGPMLDAGLSALIADLDERGLLDETLVVAVGEFGRSPQTRRQHLGQRATATTAATTGRTATPPSSPAPASSAATSTASPTRPASARWRTRSTRASCWRRSTTRRHRPGDDRLQPPEPAARAGEGGGGERGAGIGPLAA